MAGNERPGTAPGAKACEDHLREVPAEWKDRRDWREVDVSVNVPPSSLSAWLRGHPLTPGVTDADLERMAQEELANRVGKTAAGRGPPGGGHRGQQLLVSAPALMRSVSETKVELTSTSAVSERGSRPGVGDATTGKNAENDGEDEASDLKGMTQWQRKKNFMKKMKAAAAESRASEVDDHRDDDAERMTPWQRKKLVVNNKKAELADADEDTENFKTMTPWQRKKLLMAQLKNSGEEGTSDFDGVAPSDITKSVLGTKKRKLPHDETDSGASYRKRENCGNGEQNVFEEKDLDELGPPKIVTARSLMGGFASCRIGLSKSASNRDKGADTRRNPNPPYQNPVLPAQQQQHEPQIGGRPGYGAQQNGDDRNRPGRGGSGSRPPTRAGSGGPSFLETAVNGPESVRDNCDPALKNLDPKMIEMIENEIMDRGTSVHWDDIAGLESVKKVIKEMVVMPMLRPDIFTGLRGPPRGLLLFGPPGTGKTLIGKCLAFQSKATFFNISSSALTSKWFGEAEKMVRTLFAVARIRAPSVIFIDEVDSILTARTSDESDSVRRIKTEFFVQLDGAGTGEERVLLVGATNRPQELDDAARRRFVRRLYIPLPEPVGRKEIVMKLMEKVKSSLSASDVGVIVDSTEGYSGADMKILCQEASLGPVRSVSVESIETIGLDELAPVTLRDFTDALRTVRPSVASADLHALVEWDKTYGSGCSR